MAAEKKKKLLIGTDNYLPRWDGISRFLIEVVPKLAEIYDITIVAPKFDMTKEDLIKEARKKDFKITRFDNFGFKIGDFPPAKPVLRQIAHLCKEADLVWTQTIGPIGAATIYYAKKQNKKVAAYLHSLEWDLVAKSIGVHEIFKRSAHGLTKRIAGILYNKCDLLLVPSLEVSEIVSWQRIKTKKQVIHLGTDTNVFVPPKDKDDAKETIDILPGKFVIGFCGRLGREKSLITLHRAFLRLEKKRKDVVLLIVGDGIKEIRQLFENKPNIKFVGMQDNVVPFLQAMDIYVLPSLTETSSLSTMEAMACGCAVVTTPVGYVKDYIIEGYNGMFFPQEQPYVLSRKIEELLDKPEQIKKLGDNARKTIVNEYSWATTIAEIEKALEELEGKRR